MFGSSFLFIKINNNKSWKSMFLQDMHEIIRISFIFSQSLHKKKMYWILVKQSNGGNHVTKSWMITTTAILINIPFEITKQ